MAVNRIIWGAGPSDFYAFDDLVGDLQPKQPQLEVIARPGVAGERIRDTGVRAVPSQATSIQYLADLATALAAVEAYGELLDGNPYEVVQQGQSYGYYRVVGVRCLQPVVCAKFVGAVSGATSGVMLAVQWTLLNTEAPP